VHTVLFDDSISQTTINPPFPSRQVLRDASNWFANLAVHTVLFDDYMPVLSGQRERSRSIAIGSKTLRRENNADTDLEIRLYGLLRAGDSSVLHPSTERMYRCPGNLFLDILQTALSGMYISGQNNPLFATWQCLESGHNYTVLWINLHYAISSLSEYTNVIQPKRHKSMTGGSSISVYYSLSGPGSWKTSTRLPMTFTRYKTLNPIGLYIMMYMLTRLFTATAIDLIRLRWHKSYNQ
jgi:hypothetical protein